MSIIHTAMQHGLRVLVLGALAGAAVPGLAQTGRSDPGAGVTSVEVFVNSAMLVTPAATGREPYRLTIHRMDRLQQVRQSINQQIPRGGEQVARKWIAANQARIKREIQPAAVAAANAVSLSNYYRLDRIPAIVINRKSVVYGVTNVDQALQLYQARQVQRQRQGAAR